MFEDAHDNMVFTDPETGDQLIFHRKTWLCTIHGILTRYLGFTPELAYDMIKNAPLCSDAGINYHSVGMLCHDEEYHWAMNWPTAKGTGTRATQWISHKTTMTGMKNTEMIITSSPIRWSRAYLKSPLCFPDNS